MFSAKPWESIGEGEETIQQIAIAGNPSSTGSLDRVELIATFENLLDYEYGSDQRGH